MLPDWVLPSTAMHLVHRVDGAVMAEEIPVVDQTEQHITVHGYIILHREIPYDLNECMIAAIICMYMLWSATRG